MNQTDEGRGPPWPSFARGAAPCALRSASRSDGAVGMFWDAPTSAFCPCAAVRCHPGHRPPFPREHAMRTPHLRAVSAPQTLQVALYARVSSDQQAEHHTIDSQLAELTARAQ